MRRGHTLARQPQDDPQVESVHAGNRPMGDTDERRDVVAAPAGSRLGDLVAHVAAPESLGITKIRLLSVNVTRANVGPHGPTCGHRRASPSHSGSEEIVPRCSWLARCLDYHRLDPDQYPSGWPQVVPE